MKARWGIACKRRYASIQNEVKYARGGDENDEDDDEGYTEEG